MPLADVSSTLQAAWHFFATPVMQTDWTDWRGFWLREVCSNQFVVCWFLPLLPILLAVPRARLRLGVILTGLAFVAYVFGAAYAVFWLAICAGLYRVSERFAIECRRTDVLQIGPPLAAALILGGGYIGTMLLRHVLLPAPLNDWLFTHAAWLYPMGVRGAPWEPELAFRGRPDGTTPQLLTTMFWDVHLIGTAYLAVRMLHYFADIKRGELPADRRGPLNFLAYTCYAPALIQGPIERYLPFQDAMDTCHERRSWPDAVVGISRMVVGIAKNLAVIWWLRPVLWYDLGLGFEHGHHFQRHPERIESTALLYAGQFLQILALYLQFSGYCDVNAGMARLLGYRQVENFMRPWKSVSFRDFWRRWHISLSLILRDYLYIPFGGNRRHVLLNLCLTFGICGLWHALVPQTLLWGLLMGALVWVNQLWAGWMKRLDAETTGVLPAIRRGVRRLHPLGPIVSWVFTMHVFVWTLLLLFGGDAIITVPRELVRRLWE